MPDTFLQGIFNEKSVCISFGLFFISRSQRKQKNKTFSKNSLLAAARQKKQICQKRAYTVKITQIAFIHSLACSSIRPYNHFIPSHTILLHHRIYPSISLLYLLVRYCIATELWISYKSIQFYCLYIREKRSNSNHTHFSLGLFFLVFCSFSPRMIPWILSVVEYVGWEPRERHKQQHI